ncbi:MAG: hypothetical protein WD845_12090 [Pirellulales bacterium]
MNRRSGTRQPRRQLTANGFLSASPALGYTGNMSEDRKTRRSSVERSRLRASHPEMFQRFCAEIAAQHGLKVFERDGHAWASSGAEEWVFHRAINPKKLWRESWEILYVDASAINTARGQVS